MGYYPKQRSRLLVRASGHLVPYSEARFVVFNAHGFPVAFSDLQNTDLVPLPPGQPAEGHPDERKVRINRLIRRVYGGNEMPEGASVRIVDDMEAHELLEIHASAPEDGS